MLLHCGLNVEGMERGSKPKVVSCPLIDEMTPSLGNAPCPTLSVKPGHYQVRVVRSSIGAPVRALTRLSTFDPCFNFFHVDKLLCDE